MAIAERMPEVGRRYYEHVLENTINRLAAYLEAHVKAGDLAIDDCQLAASQFMLICQASLFLPFIFQAAPPPSAERIAQVVESATRMFLAAYAGQTGVIASAPAPPYSSSNSSSSSDLWTCVATLLPPSDPVTNGSREA